MAAAIATEGRTVDGLTALPVASASKAGPDATAAPGVCVRLAEAALRAPSRSDKSLILGALGAALYRPGWYGGGPPL